MRATYIGLVAESSRPPPPFRRPYSVTVTRLPCDMTSIGEFQPQVLVVEQVANHHMWGSVASKASNCYSDTSVGGNGLHVAARAPKRVVLG